MNTKALLAPSDLLAMIAKLLRHTENLGIESSHWLLPTRSKSARLNLVEYLKYGCPKVKSDGTIITSNITEDFDLAHLILNNDFITPENITEAYNMEYTEDQLNSFDNTLPDFKTLIWLHMNGYMLVAGPNKDCNLLDVLALDPTLFYREKDGKCWFEEAKHTFSRNDTVRGGQWLMLRKSDIPNSRFKHWSQQTKLVTSPERVPNVAEVAYGVTVYRKVCQTYLLSKYYVRTSSVDGSRRRVCVGDFDKTGLDIDDYWGAYRYYDMGVAAARK